MSPNLAIARGLIAEHDDAVRTSHDPVAEEQASRSGWGELPVVQASAHDGDDGANPFDPCAEWPWLPFAMVVVFVLVVALSALWPWGFATAATAATAGSALSPAQLHSAWRTLKPRRPDWPGDIAAALADPLRAWQLRLEAIRAAACAATRSADRSAPTLARPGTALRRSGRGSTPGAWDCKRAAAGDFDDE